MTMNRRLRISFAAACAVLLAAAPAHATCAGNSCDEQQIGPYVAPDIILPDIEGRFDPRGKPVSVPLAGLEGVVVRHRPGAGLWLGAAPGGANLFLKPGRARVTVDMKVDF